MEQLSSPRKNKPSSLIIDLDQTLVDSSIAKHQRSKRDWHGVYELLPSFKLISGAKQLLDHSCGYSIAVVTNAPHSYAERLLNHFELKFDIIVGWHQTPFHKPHPAPIQYALQLLNANPKDSWGIGDHSNDIKAYRAAGIPFVVGVTGVSDDKIELRKSKPDECVQDLLEIIEWLQDFATH